MYDILLKGGTIFDGTGGAGKIGDVAILAGKIAAINQSIKAKADEVVDCQGYIIAPGFIDIQNHSDSYWQLLENPTLDSTLSQGFTTAIVGNCGVSLAPLTSRMGLLPITKHYGHTSNINWASFKEFVNTINTQGVGINIGSFVGLPTLWFGLVGEYRPLDEAEEIMLENILEESMSEGALGLSIGADQTHEWIIMESVLPRLLRVLKEKNGVLSVHLRNYGTEIINSLDEVLELAKAHEVAVKISHLKIEGKENWPLLEHALEKITAAKKYIPLGFDVYPFDTVHKPLTDYLPSWAKDFKNYLKNNPEHLKRTSKWIEDTYEKIGDIVIASTETPINVTGKSLKTLSQNNQKSLGATMLDILMHGGETMVFDKCLNNHQVQQLCEHELGAVASDGAGFAIERGQIFLRDSLQHPRSFSSVSQFLHDAKVNKNIGIGEAIRKLTSLPAKLVGIDQQLGTLTKNKQADVVIMEDIHTTKNNHKTPPNPIKHVIVKGQWAIKDSMHTKQLLGGFIKKSAK